MTHRRGVRPIDSPPKISSIGKSFFWSVQPGSAERLSSFLKVRLPEWSGKRIKKCLEMNGCLVNGEIERFASRSLRVGDRVELLQLERTSSETLLLPTAVYEDEDLLLLEKPPYWSCSPEELQQLRERWGTVEWTHRLDRGTSGILVLAKNPAARKAMERCFAARSVRKVYWALVDGVPKTREGSCAQGLRPRGWFAGQQLWALAPPGEGVSAQTDWAVRESVENASLLVCRPHTGRTHQLRVHLAGMGHPILGDRQYAKSFRCGVVPPRVMLHAKAISFPHPQHGTELSMDLPPPLDFQGCWETVLESEGSGERSSTAEREAEPRRGELSAGAAEREAESRRGKHSAGVVEREAEPRRGESSWHR